MPLTFSCLRPGEASGVCWANCWFAAQCLPAAGAGGFVDTGSRSMWPAQHEAGGDGEQGQPCPCRRQRAGSALSLPWLPSVSCKQLCACPCCIFKAVMLRVLQLEQLSPALTRDLPLSQTRWHSLAVRLQRPASSRVAAPPDVQPDPSSSRTRLSVQRTQTALWGISLWCCTPTALRWFVPVDSRRKEADGQGHGDAFCVCSCCHRRHRPRQQAVQGALSEHV